MGLGTPSVVNAQDFRDISSTKQLRLGQKAETVDGRVYRYALAGAVDLSPGKVTVAAAHASNHVNVVADVARSVGDSIISATLGATAAAVNLYQDGQAVVNDATGEGISYLINSHAAVASAGILTANLAETIKVAIVASTSEVSFIKNPWASIIVSPSSISHRPVGVPNVTITAAYYGWVQTRGDCAVLSDGVVAKGVEAILSNAVDGAVETRVDATTTRAVGEAPEATVDTEYRLINLLID